MKMKVKMKKKSVLAIIGIALLSNSSAQENQGPLFLTADELATTVVNLRKEIKPNVENIGTGTFIVKGEDLYIVTASHVSKTMDSTAYIIMQGEKYKPIKLSLSLLANPVKWIDDKEADLSVLKLNPHDTIITKYLQSRFVPFEIIDTTKQAILRNNQLTIIGFPLGLGSVGHFSPLTYHSFASSGLITLKRFDNGISQTFIILENPSVGGYSGGPVYDLSIYGSGGGKTFGSGTKLHGFIHGTISDDTGGKLSAITPAYYILDLIK